MLSEVLAILVSAKSIDASMAISSLCRSRLRTLADSKPCLSGVADSLSGIHEEIR